MLVSLATAILAAFVTIFFFPETLDKTRHAKPANDDDDEDSAQEDQLPASNEDASGTKSSDMESGIRKTWTGIRLRVSGAGFGNTLLLAVSILCATVGIKATDWYGLVQYPVVKLGWTFSQVCAI